MQPAYSAIFSSDRLWLLCKNSNHKAFKQLFNNEFENLMAYGLKISSNKSDVKDAIQEIFTDLWERKSDRQIQNIKFYLLKALKYRLVRSISKGKVVDINALTREPCINPQYQDSSRSQEIAIVLSQLPKSQQEIIHLKYYQGLSNAEIADMLNINYQSVSNKLHRVIAGFRKKLQNKISS